MFFSSPDQLRGPAPKMGNTILDQNLVTKSSPPTAPIFDLTLKQESLWILMVDDKESHSRMTTAKCSWTKHIFEICSFEMYSNCIYNFMFLKGGLV